LRRDAQEERRASVQPGLSASRFFGNLDECRIELKREYETTHRHIGVVHDD
jgi:hypothetical protein